MTKKILLLSVFSILILLGCKSTPEVTVTDYSGESVLIEISGPGIAPSGSGFHDSIEFRITTGNSYLPDKWLMEILNETNGPVRKNTGAGTVPSIWSWDGMKDNGTAAPDGRYKVRVSLWFPGQSDPIVEESTFFVVDTSGPVGSVSFSDALFSPDDDGINDTLEINVSVTDELSDVQSWTLNLYDSRDALIYQFFSDRESSNSIVWDGKKNGQLALSSASDYTAVLNSVDSLGNSSSAAGGFSTDILVLKEGDSFRIRVNSITFKAFAADFMDVEAEQLESNLETLDLLASKLKKFPGYKITVEGHAVSVFWNDPVKAEKENREVLIPLSEARASIILDALKERGVNAVSMNYIGIGAQRPLVPFSDLQNRWKNRRVVFILTK
jgi:outer membrane protein OmpA-like peptidoglycan-associated protein